MSRNFRQEALEFLGFKSARELANCAGVGETNLSRIFAGRCSLSKEAGKKITQAVYRRQFIGKGWTCKDTVTYVCNTIEYCTKERAKKDFCGRPRFISLADREEIYQYLLRRNGFCKSPGLYISLPNQVLLDTSLDLAQMLEKIVEMLSKSENTKHDYDRLLAQQSQFEEYYEDLKRHISEAMNSDMYREVSFVFTEIRHLCLLCKKYDFTKQMCLWLSNKAALQKEPDVRLKAEITRVWVLSSSQEIDDLEEAICIVDEILNTGIELDDFIRQFHPNDSDVLAMLCEHIVRIPVRKMIFGESHLFISDFEVQHSKATQIMNRTLSLLNVNKRLSDRFNIAIQYQSGIYWFLRGEYEKSTCIFSDIAVKSDRIGWDRVRYATYTWLASNSQKQGKKSEAKEWLSKVDDKCYTKRKCFTEKMLSTCL